VKPAARECRTTPKTVQKWLERFEQEKKPGLEDRSRKPNRSPNEMARYWYFKIREVCEQAHKDNKRITAVRIQRVHRVPYSTKTILQVMREIKKQLRPFEKVQVDIKYLDDIPEFYGAYTVFQPPRCSSCASASTFRLTAFLSPKSASKLTMEPSSQPPGTLLRNRHSPPRSSRYCLPAISRSLRERKPGRAMWKHPTASLRTNSMPGKGR